VATPEDLDPERMFRALGSAVRTTSLSAGTGGHQALLIPRSCGGFTVYVDSRLTPAERRAGISPARIRRARLAHEFAHTFFYTDGAPPRRRAPVRAAEERFCDTFAAAVVGREAIVRVA
jgi:hypothetical protein